jgi:monoamine oxidase
MSLFLHRNSKMDTEEPSYRIQGGTQTLINRLVAEIGVENIVTKRK